MNNDHPKKRKNDCSHSQDNTQHLNNKKSGFIILGTDSVMTEQLYIESISASAIENKSQYPIPNFSKKFTVKVTSNMTIYNQLQKFLTKLYIQQYENDPTFKELKLHDINYDEVPEVLYELPENTDIIIKYNDNKVECRIDKVSKDRATNWQITYLYQMTIHTSSKNIFDAMLLESREKSELSMYYYKPKYCEWKKYGKIQNRDENTVIINNDDKEKLMKDIELFISSKNDYETYGIPYKRNYLFHGKPGTGKTSLIKVIANKFNRNIYVISFDAELNDGSFYSAIHDIEYESAILLLEDIDCIFQDRDSNNKSNVSFSAVLNILDGVIKSDHLMTFITTNHIEKLDKALIRPGRVDMMIKFTTLSEEQILGLLKLYKIKLDKNTLKEMLLLCKKYDMTASTLSGFLFRNRNNSLDSSNCISHFEKYLTEIESTLAKKDDKNMYM
jgi:ATP-dependent Zn protease